MSASLERGENFFFTRLRVGSRETKFSWRLAVAPLPEQVDLFRKRLCPIFAELSLGGRGERWLSVASSSQCVLCESPKCDTMRILLYVAAFVEKKTPHLSQAVAAQLRVADCVSVVRVCVRVRVCVCVCVHAYEAVFIGN